MNEPLIYKRIEDEIKSRIVSGAYPPGGQLPPERDLVDEFNTSRLTVAKSLASLITDGYIVRTRGRGTFVCDPLPSSRESVTTGRNVKFFHFISPVGGSDGETGIRHGLLEGLCDVMSPLGYHVGVKFFRTVEEEIEHLRRNRDCGGLVVWPARDEAVAKELKELAGSETPFVLVDSYFPEMECDYVISANSVGAELMVDHLYGLGHKNICYLTVQPDRISLSDRLSGVIAAMGRHGIPIAENLGIIPDQHKVSPNTYGAANVTFLCDWLKTMLARPNRPTALFCGNDSIAVTVMEILGGMGVRIPQELSLAGFDNIDRVAYLPVPLTTVAQDFFEIGRMAGKILLRQDVSRDGDLPLQYRIPPRLVVRDSTAPPGGK